MVSNCIPLHSMAMSKMTNRALHVAHTYDLKNTVAAHITKRKHHNLVRTALESTSWENRAIDARSAKCAATSSDFVSTMMMMTMRRRTHPIQRFAPPQNHPRRLKFRLCDGSKRRRDVFTTKRTHTSHNLGESTHISVTQRRSGTVPAAMFLGRNTIKHLLLHTRFWSGPSGIHVKAFLCAAQCYAIIIAC